MSTPFWQYKQKELFIRKKLTEAEMKRCVGDWNRDFSDIQIDNIQLQPPVGGFTEASLKVFWKENLVPKHLDEDKKEALIQFFSHSFHQGGVLYALRARLCDIAAAKGHMVASLGLNSKVSLKVINNKLIIKEEITLDAVILNSNDPSKSRRVSAEDEAYLLSGAAIYSIDLTADAPLIKCDDLVLNHYDKITENIFDTRSVWDKIVDFLKSLVNRNALDDPFIEGEQLGMNNF